jgi:hypothetical protein
MVVNAALMASFTVVSVVRFAWRIVMSGGSFKSAVTIRRR